METTYPTYLGVQTKKENKGNIISSIAKGLLATVGVIGGLYLAGEAFKTNPDPGNPNPDDNPDPGNPGGGAGEIPPPLRPFNPNRDPFTYEEDLSFNIDYGYTTIDDIDSFNNGSIVLLEDLVRSDLDLVSKLETAELYAEKAIDLYYENQSILNGVEYIETDNIPKVNFYLFKDEALGFVTNEGAESNTVNIAIGEYNNGNVSYFDENKIMQITLHELVHAYAQDIGSISDIEILRSGITGLFTPDLKKIIFSDDGTVAFKNNSNIFASNTLLEVHAELSRAKLLNENFGISGDIDLGSDMNDLNSDLIAYYEETESFIELLNSYSIEDKYFTNDDVRLIISDALKESKNTIFELNRNDFDIISAKIDSGRINEFENSFIDYLDKFGKLKVK